MWIIFALAAYAIFAAATITDKYLLVRPIPDARIYAFYTGILGLTAFLFAPFGFEMPSRAIASLGIFAGILFIAALFLFFLALKSGEVSRVGISLGGLVPLFTFVFTYVGTGKLPTPSEFIALILLASGSLIIAFDQYTKLLHNLRNFGLIIASSFIFGFYFTLAKFLFSVQPFISAFIWIKLGGALVALVFLFSPAVRKIVFEHKKSPPKKAGGIFIVKNAAGGVGALLLHLAISLAKVGQVATVNALQGAQFGLVFLGVLFLTRKYPWIVKEKIDRDVLIVKFAGMGLVVAGIVILAIMA